MSLVGPFSKTEEDTRPGTALRNSAKYVTWYRSRPARSEPCPYTLIKCSGGYDAPNTYAGSEAISPEITRSWENQAVSRCYDRFVNASKQNSAQLGTSLAEGREAVNMIATRVAQLHGAFRSLRKGDINGMLKHFGISPRDNRARAVSKRRKRTVTPKSIGDKWLEYHFGWVPLVQDVYDAVNVLDHPAPYHPNRISTVGRFSEGPSLVYDSSSWNNLYQKNWLQGTVRCRMIAEVIVTDYTLMRANQLGIVNPVSIAWELVPFSFLVDWFGNVGQYLNSFSDFVGMDVRGATTTITKELIEIREDGHWIWGPPVKGKDGQSFSMRRTLGITRPSLHFEVPKGFSVSRIATSVALFFQQISRFT